MGETRKIKVRLLVTYSATGSPFGPTQTHSVKVVVGKAPRMSTIVEGIRKHYNMPARRGMKILSVTQWPDAFFDTEIEEIDLT